MLQQSKKIIFENYFHLLFEKFSLNFMKVKNFWHFFKFYLNLSNYFS